VKKKVAATKRAAPQKKAVKTGKVAAKSARRPGKGKKK
jgi:hypothetical protein